MNSDADALNLIRELFFGRDRLIENAYRDNLVFRDLCDDYRKCFRALERWKQLEANGTGPRRQEYTELLDELRGEIQVWLEVMETGSYTSREKDS